MPPGLGLVVGPTRIVGKDHWAAAGITQTYEAREIPAKPWFRLFVERLRMLIFALVRRS